MVCFFFSRCLLPVDRSVGADGSIGAFKHLAMAEVEEVTLKFSLKISAAGGLPMIASSKTDADFAIEVKCKFPKPEQPTAIESQK